MGVGKLPTLFLCFAVRNLAEVAGPDSVGFPFYEIGIPSHRIQRVSLLGRIKVARKVEFDLPM